MTLDLSALAKAASDSWALGAGTVYELRAAAARQGWAEVPMRSTDPALSALRPQTQADAAPNSLSAVHGLGEQPLHTDGAHLRRPPDWIALVVDQPNSTPTKLWRLPTSRGSVPWNALLNGIFLVSSGPDRFLTTSGDGRSVRYDPTCMVPCDQRAKCAASFFSEAEEAAEDHTWNHPREILLINNRKALHGRRAVAGTTDIASRTVHRIGFTLEGR